MKKTIILSLILVLILSSAVLSMGKRVSKTVAPATQVEEASETVVCPVMGTKFDKENASGTSVSKGKTYYFCCGGCKPAFDKDPEKYINK